MNIVILNTGSANLSSVKWAVRRLGYTVTITKNIDVISKSKKLLIPGVGTANTAMHYLHANNLVNIIKNYKNPVLGICLGLQLFCSYSTEGNKKKIDMLNIIKQSVSLLNGNNLPIPHIGWNTISIIVKDHFLFKGIPQNSRFYFLHSYAIDVNKYSLAKTYYGRYFTSIIQKNNFFGVQFHPEKSGISGSTLLKNFLEI